MDAMMMMMIMMMVLVMAMMIMMVEVEGVVVVIMSDDGQDTKNNHFRRGSRDGEIGGERGKETKTGEMGGSERRDFQESLYY